MASFDLGGLLADPNSAGIMGLAQGLLASSGASRLPVTMGAALANGMQGMQQGFTGSIGLQQKLTQMKLLQAAMASMNGGGQPSQSFAPQADPSAAASSALSAGAQGMTPPNSDPNPLMPPGAMGAAMNRPGPTPMSASLMDAIQAQQPQMGGLMGNGGQAQPGAVPSGATIYGKAPADLYKQGMLFSLAGLPAGAEMMKIAVEHDPTLAMQMPTDAARNAAAAYGYGSPQYIAAMRGAVDKAGTTALRPGAPYIRNGQVFGTPPVAPAGYMNQPNADGSWSVVPVNGGLPAITASTAATQAGKNLQTPTVRYANGQPVFSTAAQDVGMANGGLPTAASVPNAGFPPSAQVPGTGQSAPSERAAILSQERDRIAAMPDYPNKAGDLAAVNRSLQAVQSPSGGAIITPAPAPGYNSSQQALATANAGRYNDTIKLASDSPTRVNVYDHILDLSKSGVQTGPGSEWMNSVKGYVANTPFLGNALPNWKGQVSDFQELNKFLYQNAQRNWQAAGGTGTDSQLEAFTKANPNPKMFPQALQAMAQWGKAGELALQAKTNAMQNFKDANGGNVANLDQFERSWRNSFDPMLFQLKTMDPAQAQEYVQNLQKTNPKQYQALIGKAAQLKQLGGL